MVELLASVSSVSSVVESPRRRAMVKLSVNVNKVATLRNSRGGGVPSVLDAVDVCIAAGAPGITVHPRADRRHITPDDVRAIARGVAHAASRRRVQHRRRSAARAARSRRRGAAGSVHAGAGRAGRDHESGRVAAGPTTDGLPRAIERLRSRGVRVSLFVDAAAGADPLGGVGRRRSRRAVHRAVRARVRARRRRPARSRLRRTSNARGSRTTLRPRRQRRPRSRPRQPRALPRRCRFSTRCRSATRSSRARCSPACRPWSANTRRALAAI